MTVLMCPGQGAQRVGMGKDLATRFPAARDTFAAIDDALDARLSRLMWEGPEDELTLTHNAQPAILAHSVAVLAVVGERLGQAGAAAGHSLGEYSAHVAAGSLTGVDAARLVRRRGELMLAAGEARKEFGQLEGRAHKHTGVSFWPDYNVTDDRMKLEWVVRGTQGQAVELTARHDRAGTVRAKVTLN